MADDGNLEQVRQGVEQVWNDAVWRQFGAAIDTLADCIRACPPELWGDRSENPGFWYITYHTLFWLDLYLSGAIEGFAPAAPFGLEELQAGVLPPRVYTPAELLAYLDYCREKCRAILAGLTPERAGRACAFRWGQPSFAELLLYNLRHVQDHAGELHYLLGQRLGSAPGWVTRARG
jgi:hypothetical protein